MVAPTPSAKGLSAELKAKLTRLGVPIKAWDPAELNAVIHGHRTLGELAHVSKQTQRELQATGVKLLKDGLREQAKGVFEGLEALDPYDAYVQVCLGTIAMEDEDHELAEACFTRALVLNPSSAPALAYRGELRLLLGRSSEAVADLTAALKHDSQANQAVIARARTLLEAAAKKSK
jgi:tetratricopeptide (TPR) repeat protein